MKSNLYQRVISDENIYLAIYYVETYIQEKDLLSRSDRILLKKLVDKFNSKLMAVIIKRVRKRLESLLTDDKEDYIEAIVYFKPKKYNEKNSEFEFRPIHTTSLINQIALISMLQVIVYDFDSKNKIIPSALSRLLPANFFGNRISFTGKELFKNWKLQYGEYIEQAEKFHKYCNETSEYLYEVSLDLVNFFPNINPSILYNYILSKIKLIFLDEDNNVLQLILKKLLIFKLCSLNEIETEWYLQSDKYKKISYVKGLPQGLPHTYFMANIFMTLVQKEYEKEFPGKMFFYVDDSIIFSNFKESEFADKLNKLNERLQSCFNSFLSPSIVKEYEAEEFNIWVHEYSDEKTSKSNFIKISERSKNALLVQIRTLTRQVSEVQSFNTMLSDDNELLSYSNKMKQSYSLIEKILMDYDELLKPYERKRIISYKKFFGFRKRVCSYVLGNIRLEDFIDEIKKQLDTITKEMDGSKYDSFINNYVDDILNFTLSYLYSNISNNQQYDIIELDKKIIKLCKFIYKENNEHAYFSIQNYKKISMIPVFLSSINKYSTLSVKINQFYYNSDKFSLEYKKQLIEMMIANMDICELYYEYCLSDLFDYARIIINNHEELNRMLLNALFSSIFNLPISDEVSLVITNSNQISYGQLRLMMNLRNYLFNYDEFIFNYKKIMEEKECFEEDIDCYILQVLPYFIRKVKKIKYIDNLILIHKYCADTWKNGSKFLHFYTIHNQEHAVSLIKLTKKLTVAFSLLQIKPLDYYLLYAACYLHDISMVTLPEFDNFISSNSPEVFKIYNDFVTKLDSNDYRKTKTDLIHNYNELDSYFENEIRKKHAFSSAHEIRKFPELSFIESPDRETIAQVSEAHGYYAENVYGLKSYGKESLCNLKFMMILLRLADLLDINNQRISKVILDHNLEKLNTVSRFHWLSHLITERCELYNEYLLNNDIKEREKKEIIERTIIKIKVSLPQITTVEKNSCNNIICDIRKDNKPSESYCLLLIEQRRDNNKSSCLSSGDCNFACKWFIKKNEYLINEIIALESYLNHVNYNNYKSQIQILLDINNKVTLPSNYFDYLKSYVEEGK